MSIGSKVLRGQDQTGSITDGSVEFNVARIDQESITPQVASPNQTVFQIGVKALTHRISTEKRKGD